MAPMTTPQPARRESAELRALIDQRYADVMAACRAAKIPLYDDAGVAERINSPQRRVSSVTRWAASC